MRRQVDCNKWRDLASEYIEGTLPAPMREVMANHAKNCDSCKEDEKILRGLSHALSLMPEVDPPSFFSDRVMARIEREQAAGAWWQRMLAKVPFYGRTTIGVALAGAVVAAVLMTKQVAPGQEPRIGEGMLIPGFKRVSATGAPLPVLKVMPEYNVYKAEGRSYDFRLELKNAESGNALVHVMDANQDYPFALKQDETPSPLRVPLSILGQEKAVGLIITWKAQNESRVRGIFVPTREAQNVTDEKLTFNLPQETLGEAVRDLSGAYGAVIALEDAPLDMMVTLNARDETLGEALQRQLSVYGLKVISTPSGVKAYREDANAAVTPESEKKAVADPTVQNANMTARSEAPSGTP